MATAFNPTSSQQRRPTVNREIWRDQRSSAGLTASMWEQMADGVWVAMHTVASSADLQQFVQRVVKLNVADQDHTTQSSLYKAAQLVRTLPQLCKLRRSDNRFLYDLPLGPVYFRLIELNTGASSRSVADFRSFRTQINRLLEP
jgi:hypothetical protein